MTASGATKVKLYAVQGVAGVLDLERADGSGLIEGQPVTGCANIEERALRKTGNVPFPLEDELVAAGARYRRGRLPFARHVEVGEGLVTGQNPFSSKAVARAVLEVLGKGGADRRPGAARRPMTSAARRAA